MQYLRAAMLGAAVASGALAACATAEIGDPVAGDAGLLTTDAAALPGRDAAGAADAVVPDAAPPADAAPCDDGVLNVEDPSSGSCFMYFDAVVQWETARDACLSLTPAAHLAVVTTPEQNLVVAGIPAGAAQMWLGGNDRVVEMTWAWVNDEPFAYDNWRDGEPNDYPPDGEDCMIMELANGGTWDDRNCVNDVFGYVCER